MANKPLKSVKFPGLGDTYTIHQVDTTLAVTGAAADSKKVGDEITELKADFTQLDDKIAATQITNTASGAIASFPDGADGVPVKDLVVDIEPVQDLHGQANPYPGGGGKNQFNQEAYVTSAFNTSFSGYTYAKILLKPNTQYTFAPKTTTARASGTYCGVHVISGTDPDTMSSSDTVFYLMYSGSLTPSASVQNTFTTGETGSIFIGFPSGGSSFASSYSEFMSVDWQLETGSTATAWTPYENICPISGWTGANVTQSGANLLDRTKETDGYRLTPTGGLTQNSNYCTSEYISVKPGTKYLFENMITTSLGYAIAEYDSSKSFIRIQQLGTGNAPLSGRKTMSDTTSFIRVSYWKAYSSAGEPAVIYGADEYVPFVKKDTVSIDWTTEAGTVYSGTLDVTSGVLTVDRAGVDLGTLTWGYYTGGTNALFYASISGGKTYSTGDQFNALCSMYESETANTRSNHAANQANKTVSVSTDGTTIYIRDDSYSDDASFKTAMNGVQLVYRLATPVTYQLTPQEVSTLLGLNNIWADCGDTTVDYRADTKLYIEQLTAPSEDDMVANTNIPSDTYFMIGNTLYLSTTTIPAGDTINPGTNCTLMNLASALNALNS